MLIVQIGGSQPAISFVQDCLLTTVQADLYDDLLDRIRNEVLELIHGRQLRGVLFDMSSVRSMDSFVFGHFVETARMTRVLGVDALFFGFSPGVVSALMDLDVDDSGILAFRNMDAALQHISAHAPVPADDEVSTEEPDLQEETGDDETAEDEPTELFDETEEEPV